MYKTFFKFGTAAVLGLGMIMGVAQAQDPQAGPPAAGRRGGPAMDPEQQVQRMKQQLNLTDDQVSQIRPLLADEQKQSMAVRSDTTMSREDKQAKMQSLRQDSMAKVRAILTDAQKSQYDEMIAKRQQMMQQRRQQGGDAPAPNQPNPNQ